MLDAGIQLAERIENYIPDAYVLELQGLLRVHKHPHLYGAMVGVCSLSLVRDMGKAGVFTLTPPLSCAARWNNPGRAQAGGSVQRELY